MWIFGIRIKEYELDNAKRMGMRKWLGEKNE